MHLNFSRNDHKKVSQLFEEIESASGRSKTQLFSQLKSELDVARARRRKDLLSGTGE